jgi:hypothetical protein
MSGGANMIINTSGLLKLINSMIENHETVDNIPKEEQVFLDELDGKIKPYKWKQLDYNIHANSTDLIHTSAFELLRRLGINNYVDVIKYNLNKDNSV